MNFEKNFSPFVEKIQKLETRISELEKLVDMNEDAIYSKLKNIELNNTSIGKSLLDHYVSLNKKIEKLESLVDVKKIQEIILDGANLHAVIIKFESRIKELELLTEVLKEKYNSMRASSLRKEPFRCPSCDGNGQKMLIIQVLTFETINL